MKKTFIAIAFALALTGCAEFKAAGYDVFHEPWGTVKTKDDAKCGITGINQCYRVPGDVLQSGGGQG